MQMAHIIHHISADIAMDITRDELARKPALDLVLIPRQQLTRRPQIR
jgi:hypothetical protein